MEVPGLRFLPASLRENRLLKPMRLAVQGTIEAAELELNNSPVFQLGGGFHHAFAQRGEGFCVFADAAVAISSLRSRSLIRRDACILVIDLGAHRGNGMEDIFSSDPSVKFFDIYNFQIYPGPLEPTRTKRRS